MEKINRSNVNESHVKAQDFPKSGFDLSYASYHDFVLGRLMPTAYQHIMPADKFNGSSDILYTFNTLSVPQISDVEVSQHNFYVPYRSIDTTFIKGIVPTELNGMSAAWRTPSFTLQELVTRWTEYASQTGGITILSILNNWAASTPYNVKADLISWFNYQKANQETYINFIPDWIDYIDSIVPSGSIAFTEDNLYLVLTAVLTPMFGENSLLDSLGYNYLRATDIRNIAHQERVWTTGQSKIGQWCAAIPMCEYALRAYYAIWYEWYRDDNLQKRSIDLPDWRDFGSASVLYDSDPDVLAANYMTFLLPRTRSWYKDMFVGSMPDDICRHVYAPIYTGNEGINVLDDAYQYLYAESDSYGTPGVAGSGFVNATSYKITYRDPVSGTDLKITCPLPKAVNDSLATLSDSTDVMESHLLDLRDLRKSQMLERYLKRNFYFGDEYQDRMLAHYGSKVSDNSIRRPHLLSSSVSKVSPKQEIANMTNAQTLAGTRTATAQDSAHGDSYQFFAEEFGIVISITSIMPRAQYAGICPQNMLSQVTDFPLPEFANNNDEFGRVLEVAQTGFNDGNNYQIFQFGHYPYAHAWRSRVDEVHGSFLSDKADYTFRRFFGMNSGDGVPKLNSNFILCRPNLGMFVDKVRLSGQGYMRCDNHFFVERVLPTPVEEI